MTNHTIGRGDIVTLPAYDGTLLVWSIDHRFGTAVVEDGKGRRFSFGLSKLTKVI
ncbi:hypothetical protein [Rhodococcus jostii]|uniref:hypothetical protein n=1 Tax=Rhodococcus jostii TaxID=132919 RepID=UPI003624C064